MQGSLGNREEHEGVDRSQETCLFVKNSICGSQIGFPVPCSSRRPLDGALCHGKNQKQPQETAVFIFLK